MQYCGLINLSSYPRAHTPTYRGGIQHTEQPRKPVVRGGSGASYASGKPEQPTPLPQDPQGQILAYLAQLQESQDRRLRFRARYLKNESIEFARLALDAISNTRPSIVKPTTFKQEVESSQNSAAIKQFLSLLPSGLDEDGFYRMADEIMPMFRGVEHDNYGKWMSQRAQELLNQGIEEILEGEEDGKYILFLIRNWHQISTPANQEKSDSVDNTPKML